MGDRAGSAFNAEGSLPIGPESIAAAEQRLGFALPAALVALCLRQNGGIPSRSWLVEGQETEHQIDWFLPIEPMNDQVTRGIVRTYLKMTGERFLPSSSLPFAHDAGGNFFLLDRFTGRVWYMPMDVWDHEETPEQNWTREGRPVADSFEAFLNALTDEAPGWALA